VKEQIAFRDDELNQATQFLHDNGILLHYHDVALNDLYFLDPQWLCDMLAHVISIKEINRYVKHGILVTHNNILGKTTTHTHTNKHTYTHAHKHTHKREHIYLFICNKIVIMYHVYH